MEFAFKCKKLSMKKLREKVKPVFSAKTEFKNCPSQLLLLAIFPVKAPKIGSNLMTVLWKRLLQKNRC